MNFIKTTPFKDLKAAPVYWSPRLLLYLIGLFILLDLAIYTLLVLRRNSSAYRQTHRPKYALRNFQRALQNLPSGDKEAFYAGLSDAVLNYFGDKWNRQGRGVSLDDIELQMRKDGLSENHYEAVAAVIETCAGARFAPGGSASEEQAKDQALQAIQAVEGAHA